ncbi:DUF1398 family protein [Cystobacter fuscus]|uniref:DUF1398 family protein n=1 Tax=Cystobacter fuscus TaxID=43 RepID=UPI000BB3A8E0
MPSCARATHGARAEAVLQRRPGRRGGAGWIDALGRQLAAAGVCTWVMDLVGMTCTFHSKSGEPLFVDEV